MTIMKSHASKLSAAITSICLLSTPALATVTDPHGVDVGDGNTLNFDQNSAAIGNSVKATGLNSGAFGYYTNATGRESFALGNQSTASGDFSAAMNKFNTASGQGSFAIGRHTTASGEGSFSTNYATKASGWHASSFGSYTEAKGDSAAFGAYTVAETSAAMVTGIYNELTGGDPVYWQPGDTLFVIGNGTSSLDRHNAVTVLKNGNMGINTSSPTTLLEVNGSSKLGGAGTPFNAMQLGKVDVLGGSGGQDRVIVPVTFPKPFADNPIIIVTVAAPPGISYGDAFNVTAENITSTGFDAVVKGLPIPGNQGSWGADLQVHWQAYEL